MLTYIVYYLVNFHHLYYSPLIFLLLMVLQLWTAHASKVTILRRVWGSMRRIEPILSKVIRYAPEDPIKILNEHLREMKDKDPMFPNREGINNIKLTDHGAENALIEEIKIKSVMTEVDKAIILSEDIPLCSDLLK